MQNKTKAELIRQLEEAKREIVYYRKLAEDAGNIRLRETEELSKLISDRKRAEEALKESEEKFRVLLEFLPISIFEIDNLGNMTFANPFALKSTGFVREDIDKGIHFLRGIHSSDHKMPFNISEGDTEGSEYIVRRKDGSTFHAFIKTRPNVRNGKSVGLTGYIFDLSDLKKAEREKADLENRLQRAEKMEAIGTLAGGVAHDLNNILSGIVSYPDLLLMDLPDDSPMKTPLLTILNAGKKSAEIVQDLLTLARRGVAINHVLNLNDIISEYLYSPEYEKLKSYHPHIDLEINLTSDLLNILGSSVHLSKTVMNLVSNAVEAIDSEGRVVVSTRNQYIDVRKKGYENVEEGDYVMLTVTDDGMGIPAQDLEKIFEPFFTKKVMGRSGTGLGMAVVWGTVKDHKGFIDVKSSEGTGTAIDLYFPATREEIKDVPGLRIEDHMGEGETILIVDDVEEQRDIASKMLSRLGYSAKAVSSGEQAVEYLKNTAVDLLLLDMIMDPGMDGLDTYRRTLELHPGQKAIIASGFTETDRVKEAIRLGAGKYLRKPYTLEMIGIAVKTELSSRRPSGNT